MAFTLADAIRKATGGAPSPGSHPAPGSHPGWPPPAGGPGKPGGGAPWPGAGQPPGWWDTINQIRNNPLPGHYVPWPMPGAQFLPQQLNTLPYYVNPASITSTGMNWATEGIGGGFPTYGGGLTYPPAPAAPFTPGNAASSGDNAMNTVIATAAQYQPHY